MRERLRKALAMLAALLALGLTALWLWPLPPAGEDISLAAPVTFPQTEDSTLSLIETMEVLPDAGDGLLMRGTAEEDLHGTLEPEMAVYVLLSTSGDDPDTLDALRGYLQPGRKFFLYDEQLSDNWLTGADGEAVALDAPLLAARVDREAWIPLTEKDGEIVMDLAALAAVLSAETGGTLFSEPGFGEDTAGMAAIRALLLERSDPAYTEALLAEIDARQHAVEENYRQAVARRWGLTISAIIGIVLLLLLRYALKQPLEDGKNE